MKRFCLLLMVLILICGFVSVFGVVQAQSKPAVPTFTVKLADNGYDVPPTKTTDPYTGTTTTHPGYRVEKIDIEITIKNQNDPQIEYQIRTKGHYEKEWHICVPSNIIPPNSGQTIIGQSKGQYTIILLSTEYLPDGAQIDIQVEARSGTYHEETDLASVATASGTTKRVFDGEKSGWSKTQTLTINKNSNEMSNQFPNNSEMSSVPNQQTGFSWVELIAITAVVAIIAVTATVFILRKQMTQKH
jgi:hypothetical protein